MPWNTTTEYVMFQQAIEGNRIADLRWGTVQAKQIVVSFVLQGHTYAHTFAVAIRNAACNRSYVAAIPWSAGTPVQRIVTVVIPGDTIGTWANDNTTGLYFSIVLYSGTTYRTAPNVWTAGNFLYPSTGTVNFASNTNYLVSNVGMYADPYKTGIAPSWQLPDYAQELRRCQRYWYKQFALRGAIVISGTDLSRPGAIHAAPMRTAPAATIVGTPRFWDATVTPIATSFLANTSNEHYCELDIRTGGTYTAAGRHAVQYWQDEGTYIAMSARM
jgi:hypothetical protein